MHHILLVAYKEHHTGVCAEVHGAFPGRILLIGYVDGSTAFASQATHLANHSNSSKHFNGVVLVHRAVKGSFR